MNKLKQVEVDIEDIAARARAAVEAWYEKHFHRHTVARTQPITSEEKDELHRVVASAVQPQEPAPAQASASERD